MARRFNIEVAIAMLGESVRKIEAEFKRVGETAVRELEKIRKSTGSLDSQLKDMRKNVKGAVVGFIAFDAAVKSIEEADRRLGFLNDTGRELVGNLGDISKSLRAFDIAGVAAGLGQALGNLKVLGDEFRDTQRGAMSQEAKDLEEQRNLANLLAHEGYDVVGRSLEQLQAIMAGMVSGRRDFLGSILGDPADLQKRSQALANNLSELLDSGKYSQPNTAQLELAKNQVRALVDETLAGGRLVDGSLQEWVSRLGVLSTAQIKAAEVTQREAKTAADAQAREAKRASDTLAKAQREIQEAVSVSYIPEKFDLAEPIDRAVASMKKLGEGNEFNRLLELYREFVPETRDWAKEIQYVRDNWKAAGFAEENALLLIGMMEQATSDLSIETQEVEDRWSEIHRGFGQAVGRGLHDAGIEFLEEIEAGGKITADSLGEAMKDVLLKAANEWLMQMIANIFKARAVEQASGVGSGSGSGGKGKTGVDPSIAAKGVQNYQSGGWMSTAFSTNASAGGMAGVGWPVMIMAAVAVAANWFNKNNDAKRWDQGVASRYNPVTGGVGVFERQDSQNKSTNALTNALKDFWAGFQATTGSMVSGLGQLAIQVRHDQKQFRVTFEGVVVGTFKDMNEALVAGIKAQFASAEFASAIDPAIRGLVAGYQGKDPQQLQGLIGMVQEMVDAASGLSALEREIRAIGPAAEAAAVGLREAGLAGSDIARLTGGQALDRFRTAWEQLSGYQPSPEEQQRIAEQQRSFLIAQMELYRAELMSKRAYLLADNQLARAGDVVGRERIQRRAGMIQGEARINVAEGQLQSQYLRSRVGFVQAQESIYQAEIDAINRVLAELDILIEQVRIGPINIGGGGGRGGGRGGGFGSSQGGGRFWDILLGENSALSPEQQLATARQRYDQLKARAATGGPEAKAAFEEFAERFIEEARSFYGSTAPFAEIFELVSRDLSRFGEGSNQERAARQAAIREIYGLAEAAETAAMVFEVLGLGGGRPRRRRGGGNAGAANSNTPASSAAYTGLGETGGLLAGLLGEVGGFGSSAAAMAAASSGGSSAIVRELRASSSRAAEQAERAVAAAERSSRRARRQRRGRGGMVDAGGPGEVPPPPPPPVYSGGGAVGPRVRPEPGYLVA